MLRTVLVLLGLNMLTEAPPIRLDVRVIHAQAAGSFVDPKIKDLMQEFANLKYSSFPLRDEATFRLELLSSGRIQLPNGKWMHILPKEILADGKLRLDLTVEELKFKTQVAIAENATLAVGGPPYQDGALILAVRRSNAD